MIRPVAYFCAEYALDPNLPIYAGGLGILAGDHLREASDQNFPLVAIGLYYHDKSTMKLDPVRNEQGSPILIDIPIQDAIVKAQILLFKAGNTPVYLLDTNLEENNPSDRHITEKVYVADKETRLKQELVLGIGGLRALETLKIRPRLYHLNEGHSAFLVLELIRHEMKERGLDFEEAIAFTKMRTVFTNHTLVAAGREVYSNDLVALMLTGYAQELGVPVAEVVKLGLVQESSTFSMTILPLRMAGKINAVSRLHMQKASQIWTSHPMTVVTNGIHISTWDKTGDNVVEGHARQKQELLDFIKQQTGISWDSSQLLLGWARRFVEYKRPLAILENLERFCEIARKSNTPVKIVFSGEPHESDSHGQELEQKLANLIKTKIGDIAVFLPNYDMSTAQKLTSGCDVWLNTPIVGFEACGTSGMKAALNGTLPCTTNDGWVAEVDLFKKGWLLDSDHLPDDILDVLERDIVPMYYQRRSEWQEHMQNARTLIKNEFSATRMFKEYIERMYS
jgi:glycogen phosphorylase